MFLIGAIASLCYIPGVTGAFIATQWPVLGTLLSFDLLRTCLLPSFGTLPKTPFTVFHAVGLAFVAYAFASWLHSPTPYASVFGLWQIVIMALCVWFGSAATNVRSLYAGFAVGAIVSSLAAVLQHFGWSVTPFISSAPAGIYVNSIQQGTVLALVFVALASERMWFWAAPLVPGILLSQSRGAWIALAVGVLAALGVRRLWLLCAAPAAAVLYFSGWLVQLSVSDVQRLQIWRFAWDNLTLFGWGPGVFYTVLLPYDGSGRMFYPEYAHNDGLQLAFEYGVGALLPLAIFGYAASRIDVREWPVVCAFLAAGCFSMPLFMPVTSFLFLVVVGRVLRSYGLAIGNGDRGRQNVVPWDWSRPSRSGQAIPVASNHPAKG